MLTLPYLKQILNGELTNVDVEQQVIEAPGGYDGIVSLVQTKGLQKSVVLEHNAMGELSIRPGGFQVAAQSIWIMKMVPSDGNRQTVLAECFEDMRRIIGCMVKHKCETPLKAWQPESMPYSVRNAGPNYTGYEFSLTFDEDIDLAYHALPQVNNG